MSINHLERYEVVGECWEYTGPLNSSGYPNTGANRKGHRLSYEHHVGPIPDGMLVCHDCGNRKCINPDHLYLGTHKDNYHDRHRHGTQPSNKGENNGNRKLTEEQALAIKASTTPLKQAAQTFGVSVSQVSAIRNGRSWGHL